MELPGVGDLNRGRRFPGRRVELYVFSGTGNTLLVAREIGRVLAEAGLAVRLLPMERADPAAIDREACIGLAFPVAMQGTYPLVWEFVESLPAGSRTPAFMVDTMMGYSGGLVWPMRKILVSKGYLSCGAREIRMPANVFISRGMTPRKRRLVAKGVEQARRYAGDLLEGSARWLDAPVYSTLLSRVSRSSGFWDLFRRLTPVDADVRTCTACGLCEQLCPVNNIAVADLPAFGSACILCMRCFSHCPEGAIRFRNYRSAKYRAVAPGELLDLSSTWSSR